MERVKPDFQRATIGTSYDQISDRFQVERTTFRPNELRYLSMLLDPLPAGSIVLDLGCSTGQPVAVHVAARGHRIVGVDGSAAMLAIAQHHLPEHRWIHALIEQVEFEETFAAVICWDALFHLPRQQFESVICKVHRWLEAGGRLMVSSGGVVDGHEGFTDTLFGQKVFYDSLPPDQMVAMLEAVGFNILLAEMCDAPDGGRNKGKWATVASRRA